MPLTDDMPAPGSAPAPIEDTKQEPIEIDVPAGFKPPEPSETKDGIITLTDDWRALPGGKRLRLIRLGDTMLPDKEAKDREKEPSNTEEGRAMAEAIIANRSGQGGAA